MNRILIAEDEPKLLAILCDYFESRGDQPIPAKDGLEALEKAESHDFDGVLLDIMMPGMDGRSVCRTLRKTATCPSFSLPHCPMRTISSWATSWALTTM